MENHKYNKLIYIMLIVIILLVISNIFTLYFYTKSNSNDIMNLEETAKYLHMSKDDVLYIVESTPFDMPCVKINGEYIFSKNGLSIWMSKEKYDTCRDKNK